MTMTCQNQRRPAYQERCIPALMTPAPIACCGKPAVEDTGLCETHLRGLFSHAKMDGLVLKLRVASLYLDRATEDLRSGESGPIAVARGGVELAIAELENVVRNINRHQALRALIQRTGT